MLRFILRICDYLFVLRPVILIPAWSFYLLGASAGADGRLEPWRLPSPAAAGCLTAILVTAYLLNQVFDRDSDERNNKCLFIARGIVGTRTVVVLAVIFFLAASAAYRRVDGVHRLPLFLALALALLYSLPPARLCARPFLDMAANAVGYGGIAYVLGYNAFDPSVPRAAAAAMPYVLLVAATFLHTTVLDYEGDRATGKMSTSVVIGLKASAYLSAVLHAGSLALALARGDSTATIVALASLPFVLYAGYDRRPRTSSLAVQANTLVVTLAAAAAWPAYLAVLIPLVLLSRFYHGRRFEITYPGPSPREPTASGEE